MAPGSLLTESLHAALLHFRHANPSRPRQMWADQVCINQADEAEKGKQVQLMPRIYSSASYVRVWLGSNPDVKSLVPTIPPGAAANIAAARSYIPDFDDMQPETVADAAKQSHADARARHERGEANLLDHDWHPLGAILARSWFQRKWVIQELCLARSPVTLFAGGPGGGGGDNSMSDSQEQGRGNSFPWVNVQLEWRELGELIAGISSLKWQGTLAGMDMTESNRSFNRALVNCDSPLMIQRYRHVGQLVDGIMISAGFDCHDPRDHIYGLLGLESPGPGRLIAPDYGASETEVFVRLAAAFLLHGGTNALKILAMAPDLAVIPSSCRQRPAGLPSWVPDLCSLQTDCLVDTTLRTPLFRAGGMLPPSVKLELNESKVPVLSVCGKIVDTVETTALAFADYYLRDFPDAGPLDRDLWDPSKLRRLQRTTDWLDGCLRVARQAVGQSDQTSTGLSKDFELSFARTMLCGMETGRSPLSDKALAEFPAYLKWRADRATRASRSQDERTLAAIMNE